MLVIREFYVGDVNNVIFIVMAMIEYVVFIVIHTFLKMIAKEPEYDTIKHCWILEVCDNDNRVVSYPGFNTKAQALQFKEMIIDEEQKDRTDREETRKITEKLRKQLIKDGLLEK